MGDGQDDDMIGLFDVEHRVREGLAKVPSHGLGDDAVKARGGADVGDQPVDFIVKPAGEGLAFVPVKLERVGKIVLRARFKRPGFHRPMS
jgi:hypothetical protein